MDFLVVLSDLVLMVLDIILENMPQVAVLRVFRLVRLARAFKAATIFPELAMLLRGFVAAFRAIFWGVILIVMVIAIWAILAVQLIHPVNKYVTATGIYKDCELCPHAFETVFKSGLTFFQTIVAGDSWGTLAVPIIQYEPATAIFFIMVLVSVSLAIMNLILAVIVEAAQGSRNEMEEDKAILKQAEFNQAADHFLQLCQQLDTDGSGNLSKREIHESFGHENFARTMQLMGVKQEDLETICDVLRDDDTDCVNYADLVANLLRMRAPDAQQTLLEIARFCQKSQQHMNFTVRELQRRDAYSYRVSTGGGTFAEKPQDSADDAALSHSLPARASPEETDPANLSKTRSETPSPDMRTVCDLYPREARALPDALRRLADHQENAFSALAAELDRLRLDLCTHDELDKETKDKIDCRHRFASENESDIPKERNPIYKQIPEEQNPIYKQILKERNPIYTQAPKHVSSAFALPASLRNLANHQEATLKAVNDELSRQNATLKAMCHPAQREEYACSD